MQMVKYEDAMLVMGKNCISFVHSKGIFFGVRSSTDGMFLNCLVDSHMTEPGSLLLTRVL